MDITILRIAGAFIIGWAVGFFTEVVSNFFQEKEDEAVYR